VQAPATLLRIRSDEQLVELFRNGSDEAFRALHDRYRGRLFAYMRHALPRRSRQDVEDALQDVFERAYTALRFGREAPISARIWLYRVARNRCIDELRRRPPAPSDVVAVTRLPLTDTSAVAERNADVQRLIGDLRELPEQQRSALLMRELQGLSHNELADVLGVSVGAVKSLLVRARSGLVDAADAREVSCAAIRAELVVAHDRGVKASGQVRRHLRECDACGIYRTQLRATSRALAALTPAPTLGPLALLVKLLRPAGAHGGTSAPTAGLAAPGGMAAGTAGKLAALLCAAAAVTTGSVLERSQPAGTPHRSAPQAPLAVQNAAPSTPAPAAAVAPAVTPPAPPASPAVRSDQRMHDTLAPVAGTVPDVTTSDSSGDRSVAESTTMTVKSTVGPGSSSVATPPKSHATTPPQSLRLLPSSSSGGSQTHPRRHVGARTHAFYVNRVQPHVRNIRTSTGHVTVGMAPDNADARHVMEDTSAAAQNLTAETNKTLETTVKTVSSTADQVASQVNETLAAVTGQQQ
jgi:RNA polymerase sigma factor (sigma-70 family)